MDIFYLTRAFGVKGILHFHLETFAFAMPDQLRNKSISLFLRHALCDYFSQFIFES